MLIGALCAQSTGTGYVVLQHEPLIINPSISGDINIQDGGILQIGTGTSPSSISMHPEDVISFDQPAGITSMLFNNTLSQLEINSVFFPLAINGPELHVYGIVTVGGSENYVSFGVNSNTTPYQIVLPPNSGSAGQFLQTDGTGITTWSNDANINSLSYSNKLISTTAGDVMTANVSAGGFRKDVTGATFTLINNLITPSSIITLTPITAMVAGGRCWSIIPSAGSAVITFESCSNGTPIPPSKDFDFRFTITN